MSPGNRRAPEICRALSAHCLSALTGTGAASTAVLPGGPDTHVDAGRRPGATASRFRRAPAAYPTSVLAARAAATRTSWRLPRWFRMSGNIVERPGARWRPHRRSVRVHTIVGGCGAARATCSSFESPGSSSAGVVSGLRAIDPAGADGFAADWQSSVRSRRHRPPGNSRGASTTAPMTRKEEVEPGSAFVSWPDPLKSVHATDHRGPVTATRGYLPNNLSSYVSDARNESGS